MDKIIEQICNNTCIDSLSKQLKKYTVFDDDLQRGLDFCIKAHKAQKRKSGIPYSTHPIGVATLISYITNDKNSILAALLHDVVEDTNYDLDYIHKHFGKDVANIVDGLTKITNITNNTSNTPIQNTKFLKSALTFQKMIQASKSDSRVLVVKLCDRLHNLATLCSLNKNKQIQIAKESLLIYSPIANKLGISSVKIAIEDFAFKYAYPNEYKIIDDFLNKNNQNISLITNEFHKQVQNLLDKEYGKQTQISSRIKHHYSTHLKMQAKGLNVEEVLDVYALRIIVDNIQDCYIILGIIHNNYKPLLKKFKDYIALPKENGYRSIHTSVFYKNHIFEVQIRTKQMHQIAQYGVAAHSKYKEKEAIKLNWLKELDLSATNIEQSYDEAKNDFCSNDIAVHTPKGDLITLPRGSNGLDFAYAIHSDIGNYASQLYINSVKHPLLTPLQNGDLVKIKTSNYKQLKCSWIDLLRTSKAQKELKASCAKRLHKIDTKSGKMILKSIFDNCDIDYKRFVKQNGYKTLNKNLNAIKDVIKNAKQELKKQNGFLYLLKKDNLSLVKYNFDGIILYSNNVVSKIDFVPCCNPTTQDDLMAIYNKDTKIATIHNKMCNNAYKLIKKKANVIYSKWEQKPQTAYEMIVKISNKQGVLADLLQYLKKKSFFILYVQYGRDKRAFLQYCHIEFEHKISDINKLKAIISKKADIKELKNSNKQNII